MIRMNWYVNLVTPNKGFGRTMRGRAEALALTCKAMPLRELIWVLLRTGRARLKWLFHKVKSE